MKPCQFTKMQALGNDFVVIQTLTQDCPLDPEFIRNLANRRLGVGCDQVLVLSKSESSADFNYNVFNADGSQAEHCGNGARCLAKFIHDQGLSKKPMLSLQLSTHQITAEFLSDQLIKISMGQPEFGKPFTQNKNTVYPVFIGNPHAIIMADHECPDLSLLGEQFNHDFRFPEGVNLSWARVKNPHHIDLSVYERGVGITPACGSAACATAALAIQQGYCEGEVIVAMPGGECLVEWPEKSALYLTGPATTVFSGVWHG